MRRQDQQEMKDSASPDPGARRPSFEARPFPRQARDSREPAADLWSAYVAKREARRMPAGDTAQRQDAGGAENRTGMPDRLKAGLENLSGFDLSDVRVHYNSPQPARIDALAYTQGRQIHVAPGQERHLAHEAWHAVQQMQGRVRPTMRAHGVPINDDHRLEREADVMGSKARQGGG